MMTAYIEGGWTVRRIGGAMTSLVTPFKDGVLDHVALMAHVEWQILNGIDGLVACSIAGEGAVLTMDERTKVIATCVEVAEGKVPVIATSGTNCTATTIEETRQAAALGADAALVTLPYYSKPTQKGVIHHFERLAASTDLPLIVHNLPSYTAIDLAPATLDSLAAIPSIIGIADGTGDIGRISAWRSQLPERISLFSAHDPTASTAALSGAQGAISAVANVAPRLFSAMQHAAAAGNLSAVFALSERLLPLFQALSLESQPATVKQALHILRDMSSDVRLPLVGVDPATDAMIREALLSAQVTYKRHCPPADIHRLG
ncbi:4-hydroxy-tetrahydrodipicolinate synthase [Rhizobium tubonense]|nr:4-hydroxy-tetrahydrodipicolinate synthase [Rhizobium tubonense]